MPACTRVDMQGERERIPARVPAQLRALITACWDQDPSKRPSFGAIVRELQAIEASGVVKGMPARVEMSSGCCTIM